MSPCTDFSHNHGDEYDYDYEYGQWVAVDMTDMSGMEGW